MPVLQIDHQPRDALAMVSSIAKSLLGRFRAPVVEVQIVLPGEPHATVALNAHIADFAIGVSGVCFGNRYCHTSFGQLTLTINLGVRWETPASSIQYRERRESCGSWA
jgi:hypothetical protein